LLRNLTSDYRGRLRRLKDNVVLVDDLSHRRDFGCHLGDLLVVSQHLIPQLAEFRE
jgi:hypothetical protein